MPGEPEGAVAPYILVDRVDYSDAPPWPTGADGDVVINEIMYHQAEVDDGYEFVEVYNASPVDIDVTGSNSSIRSWITTAMRKPLNVEGVER